MKDMKWYVYVENFNARKIEKYDIFQHGGFANSLKKSYQKHKDDYEAFCEDVKRNLMYYFWSKCEWEIILSSWPQGGMTEDRKIDVFEQVMLNEDVFMKYVWDMAHTRKNARRIVACDAKGQDGRGQVRK